MNTFAPIYTDMQRTALAYPKANAQIDDRYFRALDRHWFAGLSVNR